MMLYPQRVRDVSIGTTPPPTRKRPRVTGGPAEVAFSVTLPSPATAQTSGASVTWIKESVGVSRYPRIFLGRPQTSAAQFCGRVGRGVSHSLQEASDSLSILGRYRPGDRPDSSVVLDQTSGDACKGFRGQLDQDVPTVGGVGTTPNPACLFEPVDEHRDRPRGERQTITQLALGELTIGLKVFKGVEVGGADTCRRGEGRPHAVSLESEPLEAGRHLLGLGHRH